MIRKFGALWLKA